MPSRLTTILDSLRLAWPQANVSGASLAFYATQLEDIDTDLLEAAVKVIIRTGGDFFPGIGTIRRAAKDLGDGDGLVSPAEAWGLVRTKEHRKYTCCNLIERAFDDVTSRWQLDNASAYEMTQHRHAFMQRYAELLADERMEQEITPDIKRLVDASKTRAERLLTTEAAKPEPPKVETDEEKRRRAEDQEWIAETKAYNARCAEARAEGKEPPTILDFRREQKGLPPLPVVEPPKPAQYVPLSEDERAKRLEKIRSALKPEASGG